MNNNNLDNLFKKALQDKNCEPPAYIWDNIEQQIYKGRTTGRFRRIAGISAAALIAIILGISLLHKEKTTDVQLATISEPDSIILKEDPENRISRELTGKTEDVPTEIHYSNPKNDRRAKQSTKQLLAVARIFTSEQPQEIIHSKPFTSVGIKTAEQNFIPLTSKEALQNNESYQALLKDKPEMLKNEKNKLKFEISGHFVPAYSSGNYSSSVKNSRGANYSSGQMEGLMNTGGGLRLSVSPNKKISIQTGLYYSRMGQKTTENTSGFRTSNFSLQHTEKMRTTPLGNIRSKTRAVAYRSPEAIVLNSMQSAGQTLEQIFGSLEIPLHVRYLLNDNKIRFSLSGGVSGNFIVNNKVYLKSDQGKELLGSTENIRNFNMSTDLGLGIEYPVSRAIKIMLEPGFRYYLQSLSEDSNINFKPYLFTFSTGIGIEF